MKFGIKVSLDRDTAAELKVTRASMAEVWYNATKPADYSNLFALLRRQKIDVGLHFWATLPDGTWTNLAYPDHTLITQSMDLIKKTINVAARNRFQYVNIHPGCQTKVHLDFTKEEFTVMAPPVDLSESETLFYSNTSMLHEYALSKGIVLTIESVPARVTDGWYDPGPRIKPKNIYELPIDVLIKAAQQGLFIANDFCHTAADIISDSHEEVWRFLLQTTILLLPSTKLVHLGYIVPPFNGTDNHDVFDNPVLDTDDAIPNKQQMIDLLKLFQNRDDVWILVEPKKDHVKNYFLAREILESAGVLT